MSTTDADTLFRLAWPNEKRPQNDGRRAAGICQACQATMFWTHNPITGVWTPLVKREREAPQYIVVYPELAPEAVQLKHAIDIPALTIGQLLAVTRHVELLNGCKIPADWLTRHGRVSHFTTCSAPERFSRR